MSSRLNAIYHDMKTRCYDINFKYYKNYGGRGITICDEWLNSEIINLGANGGRCTKGWLSFKEWALSNGYTDKLSIDRVNNNKGYCPENCRWITNKEQSNNRRSNRLVTYKGKIKTLSEWCDEFKIDYDTVIARLNKYHWPIEKALETKEDTRLKVVFYKGRKQSIAAWCKELGLKHGTVYARINRYHWSVEKAFET